VKLGERFEAITDGSAWRIASEFNSAARCRFVAAHGEDRVSVQCTPNEPV
jgi:hypothetical protein